jgi:uncharacterized damage-inducible protein DinB
MNKVYRQGAIGALTDEYEKALGELRDLLGTIVENRFATIIDNSVGEDFQSVRNIVLHVVRSGYVYANHIRNRFGNQVSNGEVKIETIYDGLRALDKMFQYTVETFEDKWLLSDNDLLNTIIKTSWTTYDLEAIIEHAIVHVLRHRLQIQKRLGKLHPLHQ